MGELYPLATIVDFHYDEMEITSKDENIGMYR